MEWNRIVSQQETRHEIKEKGSDVLSVTERILTIRLMEKVEIDPADAQKLGIEVANNSLSFNHQSESESEG